MASDEDKVLDRFRKRYRHSDFLHSRNDQHKIVDLHIFKKQHVEKYPMTNLFKFDYRKVKLADNFKTHYDEEPCEIYIKTVAANIIKGHHLKVYLQIMSSCLPGLLWKVFATIINSTNKKPPKIKLFC